MENDLGLDTHAEPSEGGNVGKGSLLDPGGTPATKEGRPCSQSFSPGWEARNKNLQIH